MPRSRKHERRRGVTAVEMAFVIPIVLTLVLAAVDFSRANMIRNTMENAAFAGARRGMLPGSTEADITAASQQILDILAIKNATITVSPSSITDLTTQVTVSVTAPLSSNLYSGVVMLKNKSITRSCTLTREQFSLQLVN